MTPQELDALDRESIAVWPCLREEWLGEWLLRYGGGVYGRSNSVQPFGNPGIPIEEAIDRCEAAYAADGLPVVFRLPRFGDWQPLDRLLASRGYEINDAALVQAGPIGAFSPHREVRLAQAPDPQWLQSYFASSGRGVGREASVERILSLVPHPRRFATVLEGDRIGALGVGTVFHGTLWMFGIATDPVHRGRGHARRICETLMAWARTEGARRSALQVSATNEPAVRLYAGLGFATAYDYIYRRRFL